MPRSKPGNVYITFGFYNKVYCTEISEEHNYKIINEQLEERQSERKRQRREKREKRKKDRNNWKI